MNLLIWATDKQVRDLAMEYAPYAAEEAWVEEVAQSEPAPPGAEDPSSIALGTDPTVAHAGLTEIDAPGDSTSNGFSNHVDPSNVPGASNVDAGAANSAAEAKWDVKASVSTEQNDWVEVPRDPAETETGTAATPAGMTNTQSWAEDVPSEAPPTYTQPSSGGGDGFHEVQHHRGGRGRGGQGEHRGGNRGRGFRGDRGEGGGRGRGGFRGDRGGGDGERRGRGRGGHRGNRGRGDAAS